MASDKKPLPARPTVVEQSASHSRRAKTATGESTSPDITVAHDLLNILESAKSRPTGGKASQTRTTGLIHISAHGNGAGDAEEGGQNTSWMKMAMVIAVAAIGVGGISSWLKKSASQPATAPVTATAEPAPAKINTINSATPASPNNVTAIAPAATPATATRSTVAAALAATAAVKTAQTQQEAEHERERQKELDLQAQKEREADEERENALREPASRAEETNGAAAPAQPAGAAGSGTSPNPNNDEMAPQQPPPVAAAPPESASQ